MKKTPAPPLKLPPAVADKLRGLLFAMDENTVQYGLETAHDVLHAILTLKEILGIDVVPLIMARGIAMLTGEPDKLPYVDAEFMTPPANPVPAAKKPSTLTPEGRKRLSRKLKASWAKKRKAKTAAARQAKA